jgi:hypothetical protein
MITQNPSTQESVSRTLDFGQDAAVAPIPITDKQVEENIEMVANLQVADDEQVEGAVLEELVDVQVDEQEFAQEAALEEGSECEETGATQQVTTIEDKITLPSLAQCVFHWKKNNPQKSGKHEWIRILAPKNKIYESRKTRLNLERRPFKPGVDQWMTTFQSSALVRLCFPNIDRGLIVKYSKSLSTSAPVRQWNWSFFH